MIQASDSVSSSRCGSCSSRPCCPAGMFGSAPPVGTVARQYSYAARIGAQCSRRERDVAGRLHVVAHGIEKVEADVHVHEHVRVRAHPVEQAGALRQLVPDGAGALVLVAHDERELVACAHVRALAQAARRRRRARRPPKNHAYCGRRSPRDGPYPATIPQPSCGLQTQACSSVTCAQRSARFTELSGVSTSTRRSAA